MRIRKLRLHNFRNFKDEAFDFPNKFTVVIGENGKGKSSLLQGLRLAAASFLLGLDEPERHHIQKEDIRRVDVGKRFAPQKDCFFEADGTVAGKPCEWKRTLSKENGRTDYKDAGQIIGIAKELNDLINLEFAENISLPVICFFSTARLWAEPKRSFKLKKKGSKLKDGYSRCLDVRSEKVSSLEWIKSNYYKGLKGKGEDGLLDAVLEAITTCVPGWSDLEWDEDYDDLAGTYTEEDGRTRFIPLYYLSDGQRTMASMVAEIAYRCAILNSHFERLAVKESQGIVLIDEIDMHLHPNWQRNVAADLKRAFPNIQFVATTHSPFIIQSLDASELINLDHPTDVRPKDLSLEEVAENIMGVESAYAVENAETEEISLKYLDLLNKASTAEKTITDSKTTKELDNLETRIADPAVRAFLQMKRLGKTTKNS